MMNANMLKVALVSSIMIMSSLAGCLSDDVVDEIDDIIDPITEPEPILEEPEIYGKVMVSTYHVGELVKAVGGENIHVDYMSQDNIPVHDYEPSPADIVRLAESDLFFYHGLGLEPWVESTLASMNNAPPSFMTHTMQSGETTLDYDSLLVSNLCELMTEGPFETTTLGMMDDHDDHDDDIQTTADHDDHSNEEYDHDGHDYHHDQYKQKDGDADEGTARTHASRDDGKLDESVDDSPNSVHSPIAATPAKPRKPHSPEEKDFHIPPFRGVGARSVVDRTHPVPLYSCHGPDAPAWMCSARSATVRTSIHPLARHGSVPTSHEFRRAGE